MSATGNATRLGLSRDHMAWRCAQDIPDGAYVNLGIGIPEKVATHVPGGREVVYHSENGFSGLGRRQTRTIVTRISSTPARGQ